MKEQYLELESHKDGRFLVLQRNWWDFKRDDLGCRVEDAEGNYTQELRKSKVIKYDLSEKCFKRELKSGELRHVAESGVATFFRNLDKDSIAGSFTSDHIYRKLLKMVWEQNRYSFRRNCNFVKVFDLLSSYLNNESFLAAGIKLKSDTKFNVPLKQFTKPIQRFMKESQFDISRKWEQKFTGSNGVRDTSITSTESGKVLTDLCQHVMTNYHDDLEIYRHIETLVDSWGRAWNQFVQICTSMGDHRDMVEPDGAESDARKGYGWEDKVGYNGDHKHLFDYLVKVCRTEAMEVTDALGEYHDYLSMSRRIERLKKFTRLREKGWEGNLADVGFPNYSKIEKYPKSLTIVHRMVTRNWNVISETYDELKFAAMANKDYEWADREYCVLIPSTSQDVKDEGTNNNHCVGSYVSAIMEGRTQIGFMRYNDELDESLLTIEVRSDGIQQVRGYGNRMPTEGEIAWLAKYAKAKNLSFELGKVEHDSKLGFNTSKGQWNSEWNMPNASVAQAKDDAVRAGMESAERRERRERRA